MTNKIKKKKTTNKTSSKTTKKIIQKKEVEKTIVNQPKKVNKLKIIIFLLSAIVICLGLIFSTSYALWKFSVSQTNTNAFTTDCFSITFSDRNNITLDYAFPLTDEDAEVLTPYEFTITNTCDHGASYQANLETLSSSTLDPTNIRIKVDDDELFNYGDNGYVTKTINNASSAVIIKTGILKPKSSITHKLNIWLKSNAIQNEVENKSYASKVSVITSLNKSSYSIALNLNEGTLSSNQSELGVIEGYTLGSLPIPKKTGYFFDGWYADSNYTTAVDKDTIVTSSLKELYAKYTAKPVADDLVNPPQLSSGFVPVKYVNGITVLANPNDTIDTWYNYNEHRWANAVIVDDPSVYLNENGTVKQNKVGQEVIDILEYLVWIPRYKYQLFSNATNIDNKINGGSTPVQQIQIEFVDVDEVNDPNKSQYNGYNKGEWYVHPAFTFGEDEIKGIWVEKFESSYDEDRDLITSLPNKTAYVGFDYKKAMNTGLALKDKLPVNASLIDTHTMINMEWGAVTYLTESKYGRYNADGTCIASGCQVWINNASSLTTGCSAINSAIDAAREGECGTEYTWNGSLNNGKSSTTGNIYGIYDMSGGAKDIAIGFTVDYDNQTLIKNEFGFFPDPKYYTYYKFSKQEVDFDITYLGDALRETQSRYNSNPYNTPRGGWYDQGSNTVKWVYPRYTRGGYYNSGEQGGLYSAQRDWNTNQFTIRYVIVKN